MNCSRIIFFSMLFINFFVKAQSIELPKKYTAYYTKTPLNIDGDDRDISWKNAPWTELFIDIEGVKKPKHSTRAKMLWDDTYFYILAKMDEPHVWGTITHRDAVIYHNNDFEVFVDPDSDTHNYYELEINPLNTVWDLYINKPYREQGNMIVNNWTIEGLKSAVKVHGTINDPSDVDTGWTLEIAIPWAVFKTSYYQNNVPKDSYWRVNFSRVNWDFQQKDGHYQRKEGADGKLLPEYNWVWSPMGKINIHEPEKWGFVYFSSNTKKGNDSFNIPNDEKIKMAMYHIHRLQKAYFKKNGEYATYNSQLKTQYLTVDDEIIAYQIESHSLGYNIIVTSPFTKDLLLITEDGKFIVKKNNK